MKSIKMEELLMRLENEKLNLIDIRSPFEYQRGTIGEARNIPVEELEINFSKYLQKDKTYYLFCSCGSRSKFMCQNLAYYGYNVVNVLGGYNLYLLIKRI